MRQGYISQYFTGFASKRLSAVEAEQHRSNQHEFGGVAELRAILGDADRRNIPALFLYLSDDDEPVGETGFVSWYDARRAHEKRTEWRLYYSGTSVSERISEGDLLIFALRPDSSVMVIVAERGSSIACQLLWLFGAVPDQLPGFSLAGESDADRIRLAFASRFILQQLGIDADETDEDRLDDMVERFGAAFPSTRTFSTYARETTGKTEIGADPDAALLAFLEREELLFRTLERHLIGGRLQQGFTEVEDFLQFSLSVQNRRKSRAGSALENHLEHIFGHLEIRHDRTPVTEGRARPDFLFPGAAAYLDASFPDSKLTVLAVKSSCRDRWRQILAEADRLPEKHLLTLEPAISPAQTGEMEQKLVKLVVPAGLHSTYLPAQASRLLTLTGFCDLLIRRQAEAPQVSGTQATLL